MRSFRHGRATRPLPLSLALLALTAAGFTFVGGAVAAQAPVSLGRAAGFGVLSATGATTVGATVINGDLGSAGAITGPFVVNGVNHGAAGLTAGARADAATAYTVAAGATSTAAIPGGTLGGGQSLTPGVYTAATTIDVTGSLVLTGSSSAVWIFQAGTSLTVNPGTTISFAGGAQACNVFWQVGSDATLNNGGGTFAGTILAANAITVTAAAVNIDGRLLARDASVTFIDSTVNVPRCAAAPAPVPAPAPEPDRSIYCDANGTSYNLVDGQNTQPPYDTLGLVPAYVDPVTGAESCTFPAAPTATTPTATTSTATTPTATTPTATTPTGTTTTTATTQTPKPKPRAVKKVAAARKTAALKKTAAPKKVPAKTHAGGSTSRGHARPPITHVGLTG
jgi:type VI secretion system secreted protein VgrG